MKLALMDEQERARSFSWIGHAPYASSWLRGSSPVNTSLVNVARFLSLLSYTMIHLTTLRQCIIDKSALYVTQHQQQKSNYENAFKLKEQCL